MPLPPRARGALAGVFRLSRRTWILLATGAVTLGALVVSLAILALVHVWRSGTGEWAQVPAGLAVVVDNLAHGSLEALLPTPARVPEVVPDSSAGTLPVPSPEQSQDPAERLTSAAAEEARRALDRMAPDARAMVDRGRDVMAVAAPGLTERIETEAGFARSATERRADVPGEDLAELPRHPALARTGYALNDGKRSVRYAGPVSFEEAVSFHRGPLIDAGYRERIVSSTAGMFSAGYTRDDRSLVLTVSRRQDQSSDVALAEQ